MGSHALMNWRSPNELALSRSARALGRGAAETAVGSRPVCRHHFDHDQLSQRHDKAANRRRNLFCFLSLLAIMFRTCIGRVDYVVHPMPTPKYTMCIAACMIIPASSE